MSLFHLGRADEARELFSAASARMGSPPAPDTGLGGAKSGHDDLILWLACREAEALLTGSAPQAE